MNRRKLALRRETLMPLQDEALARIVGGADGRAEIPTWMRDASRWSVKQTNPMRPIEPHPMPDPPGNTNTVIAEPYSRSPTCDLLKRMSRTMRSAPSR